MAKGFHYKLQEVLKSYRNIKSGQSKIRHDIDRLFHLEHRAADFKRRIAHLQKLQDASHLAKEANKIVREERHFLNDMTKTVNNTIKWAKEQKKIIRRIRKQL